MVSQNPYSPTSGLARWREANNSEGTINGRAMPLLNLPIHWVR